MKKFTFLKGFLSLFLLVAFTATELSAQTASLSPLTPTVSVGATLSLTATATGFCGNQRNYTWTAVGASPASVIVPPANNNTNTQNFTFASTGTYTITVQIFRTAGGGCSAQSSTVSTTVTVIAANLWAANGTGAIQRYAVNPVTGDIIASPSNVVVPSTSTAALAKNLVNANDPDGCLYYLNRDDNNTLNGVVTIYAVRPDGTGNGSVGTIDMNGALNDDFSYVRMGFDATGKGWILAGSGSNIYIASFVGKGVGSTLLPADINTFGSVPLTVDAPGVATEFQNGDLAISGNGVMYALANVTNGQTYIYTLNSLASPTTLTRKWTVQTGGGTFSGSVNGLAWTQSGSLHFSTATGIYFIDQATANTVSGTVQATLVPGSASTTLTDLASDKFPTQSTLPVKLGSFTVVKQGNNALVNWTTLTETSTDHFEIERSLDGVTFSTVGSKQAAGSTAAETSYQYIDPLNTSARIIYYRLKTVDIDANKTYSKIVALRLDGAVVKNFTVYPNPFTSDLKIEISSTKETSVTLKINNSLGQQVINRKVVLQTGDNTVVLSSELSTLKSGMYILEITTDDGKLTQKIIKR